MKGNGTKKVYWRQSALETVIGGSALYSEALPLSAQ